MQAAGRERNSDRASRSHLNWRPNINGVMDELRVDGEERGEACANLFIFGEARRDNFVCVFDVAACRNIYGYGHFCDGVGLRNIPSA